MSVTRKLLTAVALSCTFTLAHADVVQVWDCKLNAGKTETDLNAVSSAWLAAAKKLPGNAEVEVYHNFPVAAHAGDGGFMFITITPDFKAWGNAAAAYPDPGVDKANQAWAAVASCAGSSLWASQQVK